MKKQAMSIRQIQDEWKKLDFEMQYNKPNIEGPYPPEIVRRRELLLIAQVYLANVMYAKAQKDKQRERFETEMYSRIMEMYYQLE